MKNSLISPQLHKIATALALAALLGAGTGIVKHEAQLAGVEAQLQSIRTTQERIEHKLDRLMER